MVCGMALTFTQMFSILGILLYCPAFMGFTVVRKLGSAAEIWGSSLFIDLSCRLKYELQQTTLDNLRMNFVI